MAKIMGLITDVESDRPVITYDGHVGARITIGAATTHLTDAEIDRIVAARDEYHRETKHRGYPA